MPTSGSLSCFGRIDCPSDASVLKSTSPCGPRQRSVPVLVHLPLLSDVPLTADDQLRVLVQDHLGVHGTPESFLLTLVVHEEDRKFSAVFLGLLHDLHGDILPIQQRAKMLRGCLPCDLLDLPLGVRHA